MARGHGSKTRAEQGAVIRPWTLASTSESVGSPSVAPVFDRGRSNVCRPTRFSGQFGKLGIMVRNRNPNQNPTP